MKTLRKVINWIITPPYKRMSELNSKIRSIMYLLISEDITPTHLEVVDIRVIKNTNTNMIIRVSLGRPELLIGEEGKTINRLVNQLAKVFRKKVEIQIKEVNVWL